ncbi:MAG: hypothetical protein JNL77_03215 [Nitrosomonas sp.]|nr:hypothetical protein [Nitrosomonas sp.]
MSDSFTAMVRWAKKSLLLSKQGEQLMSTECKEANYLKVAEEVTKFLSEKYGGNLTDPEILEGMWLAMQMVGGPKMAAIAMRSYVFKVD